MEHPLDEASFGYKKTRDEKSLGTEKSDDGSPRKNRKIKRNLLLLSNEMEPTNEELEYRKSKMNSPNVLVKCKQFLKCTKCNKNYKTALSKNQKVSVHPFLGVLMCKSCCNYYGDGNFSLDSDNEDKYCRWCGEGGKIFSCSKCIYGFCSVCIKKHFGIKYLNNILKDDDWLCFFCNPKPLWYLRFVCSLLEVKHQVSEVSSEKASPPQITEIQRKRKQGDSEEDEPENKAMSPSTSKPKRRRVIVFSDNEESDCDSLSKTKEKSNSLEGQPNKKESTFPTKSSKVEKLEKILKLLEYHLSFGLNWTKKLLLRLNLPNHMNNFDFFKECQKTKCFLSLISSHLTEFYNSVESLEKNSPLKKKNDDNVVRVDDPSKCGDLTSYSDILLFLGFVTNQVKAFMDIGISVQDLVETETINDDTLLGFNIKKYLSNNSRKAGTDNWETIHTSGGPSKASVGRVVESDKKLNCSESKTSDKTSGVESNESVIFNEVESTEVETEEKAKKLTEISDEPDADKRVVESEKKLNCSQSEASDKTSGDESNETVICNEVESTEVETEGKAKKLTEIYDEPDANSKGETNSKETTKYYEEILAILEDS